MPKVTTVLAGTKQTKFGAVFVDKRKLILNHTCYMKVLLCCVAFAKLFVLEGAGSFKKQTCLVEMSTK